MSPLPMNLRSEPVTLSLGWISPVTGLSFCMALVLIPGLRLHQAWTDLNDPDLAGTGDLPDANRLGKMVIGPVSYTHLTLPTIMPV